jgi:hypothetical protein
VNKALKIIYQELLVDGGKLVMINGKHHITTENGCCLIGELSQFAYEDQLYVKYGLFKVHDDTAPI